ncbi:MULTISPECIES: hypothetical protein [unclassified Sutcliffiella]|uniref:hypothetical protein n=1 Tax=unclassified Sutcliffiella TaxID=2837532 RepID=UPI0030D56486
MKLKEINRHITQSSDKDLLEFIRVEFLPSKDSSNTNIRNNYNTLKKVPKDVVTIGIARLKNIEENNDVPKSAPLIIPLILLIIASYSNILPEGSYIGSVLVLLLSLAIFVMLIPIIAKAKLNKSKALYFRELLESVEKKDNH